MGPIIANLGRYALGYMLKQAVGSKNISTYRQYRDIYKQIRGAADAVKEHVNPQPRKFETEKDSFAKEIERIWGTRTNQPGIFYRRHQELRQEVERALNAPISKLWSGLGSVTANQLDRESKNIKVTGVNEIDTNFSVVQKQIGIISNAFLKYDQKHLDLEKVMKDRIIAVNEITMKHNERNAIILDSQLKNVKLTLATFTDKIEKHDRILTKLGGEVSFLKGQGVKKSNNDAQQHGPPPLHMGKNDNEEGGGLGKLLGGIGLGVGVGLLAGMLGNMVWNYLSTRFQNMVNSAIDGVKKDFERRMAETKQHNKTMNDLIDQNEKDTSISEEERTRRRTAIVRDEMYKKWGMRPRTENKDAEKENAPAPTETPKEEKKVDSSSDQKSIDIKVTDEFNLHSKKDINITAIRAMTLTSDRIELNASKILFNGIDVTQGDLFKPPPADTSTSPDNKPDNKPQGLGDSLVRDREAIDNARKTWQDWKQQRDSGGSASPPDTSPMPTPDTGGTGPRSDIDGYTKVASRSTGTMTDAPPTFGFAANSPWAPKKSDPIGDFLEKDNTRRRSDPIGDFLDNNPQTTTSSRAVAGDLTKAGKAERMQAVYNAFRKLGYTDTGARVMAAEVQRETGYKDQMFGFERDPYNRQLNGGMLNMAHDRLQSLQKYLSARGLVNKDGTFVKSTATVDAMARWHDMEMGTGGGIGTKSQRGQRIANLRQMLRDPKAKASDLHQILGRDYIRWRIDDPRYSGSGLRNLRNAHEFMSTRIDRSQVTSDSPSSSGTPAMPSFVSPSSPLAPQPRTGRSISGFSRSGQAIPRDGGSIAIPRDGDSVAVPRAGSVGGKNYKEMYKENTERLLHQGGNMRGVDPKLLNVLKEASKDLPPGYHAEIISGRDARATGTKNHPAGLAIDLKIYDDKGKALAHGSPGRGWRAYEQLYQSVHTRGKAMYPKEKFIWGGAWVSRAAGVGDKMHYQRVDPSVRGSSQTSGDYDVNMGLSKRKAAIVDPYNERMSPKEIMDYRNNINQKIDAERLGKPVPELPQKPVPEKPAIPKPQIKVDADHAKSGGANVAGLAGSPSGPAPERPERVEKAPNSPDLEPKVAGYESRGEREKKSTNEDSQAGHGGDEVADASTDPSLSYPTQDAGDSAPPAPGDNGSGDYKHCLI